MRLLQAWQQATRFSQVVSPARERGAGDQALVFADGRASWKTIAALKPLHARVVVLAACETLRRPDDVGTRALSLAAAFVAATPKSGYSFVNGPGPAGVQILAADICVSGVPTSTQYFITAAPSTVGTTGTRFFATDHSGSIVQDNAAIATIAGGVPLQ